MLSRLIGKVTARQYSLEHDIKTTRLLIPYMLSDHQQGYQEGRARVLEDWQRWNASLLANVERLLEEAKSDGE